MPAFGNPVLVRGHTSVTLERVRFRPDDGSQFNEQWLQRLIHEHPESLPIDEIEPGFAPPVSICMELPTRHGPIDNFLLTPEGDLVLVEAKLWRNPEARRKVVAQALDYAACLFEMDYAELEAAALRGDFGNGEKPLRLYDSVEEFGPRDEPAFIDSVNRNLRNGRILILVAGDGIRTEAERLVGSLQSHAGFHFTLALVELAVYQVEGGDGLFVQPRTLAKTCMIDRGVVTIDDRRAAVRAPRAVEPDGGGHQRRNITAEQFYEAMEERKHGLSDEIQLLLGDLEEIGVYPDYQRSLNLKWDPPTGKPVNLAYIFRSGQVWTDASNWFAPKELSHAYNEELAAALGVEVNRQARGDNWYVQIDGRAPRIEEIAGRFDAWRPVVERFLERLRRHLAEADVS